MCETNGIEIFNKHSLVLKEKIFSHLDNITKPMNHFFGTKPKFIIFLSVSDGSERARVFTGAGNTAESGWMNAIGPCRKYIKDKQWNNLWIKADIVKEIQKYSLDSFIDYVTNTRVNYLREGISLDSSFTLAFLEQEVNANMFFKRDQNTNKAEFHFNNINHYLKNYRAIKFPINQNHLHEILTFTTYSYFYDTECVELHTDPLNHGRRKVEAVDKALVYQMIDDSSVFLANQVEPDGKFVYGYFPCFDKKIEWYNMLRHASTTYSMIEAYDLTKNEALADRIKRAIDYLVREGIRFVEAEGAEPVAYVIDWDNHQEIKLGANAAAILALAKFTTVFETSEYRDTMTALANGISTMQDQEQGSFIHVLNYPSLSVKDKFRIVYYDGEAAFALMRLYAIDQNEKWLAIVEKAFAYFIKENYWKHHDHWLSYCTNELTLYKPLKAYFEFGLQNVADKLDFIIHRDTTYPTFLELLMATYKMINQIQAAGMNKLMEKFDIGKLRHAIESRLNHQLNGYFFPEVAMYFKSPRTILGSFYIRHHSFRCRIDDVEHNISGYYNYFQEFLAAK